jgi:hypothetical protein
MKVVKTSNKKEKEVEVKDDLRIDPTNIDYEIENSASALFYHGQIVAYKEREIALAELQLKADKRYLFLDLKSKKKEDKVTEKEIEAMMDLDETLLNQQEKLIELRYQLSLAIYKYESLKEKGFNIRSIFDRRKGE